MISIIQNPKRLLITSPHHLGDLVAKVPFIRLLKKYFPDCHLILLCRSYVEPLAKFIPEIDEILDFESFFSQTEKEIISALKALKLDTLLHILSVQNPIGPDVIEFAKGAGIPNRIGNLYKSKWTLYKKKNFGMTHNVRKKRILPNIHEFEWNLFPLSFFGINSKKMDIPDLLKTKPLSKEPISHLKPNQFHLVIHPGSFGNAKEWPLKSYIQLIQNLDPNFQILLTGSKEEKHRFDFSSVQERVLDLRGQLELSEFIHLLSQVDGLLAGSTGPLHIASLFGIKTLGLFPKQKHIGVDVWRGRGALSENFESPIICLPCQKKLTDLNKKLCRCMDGISVESVQKKLENWSRNENLIRQ